MQSDPTPPSSAPGSSTEPGERGGGDHPGPPLGASVNGALPQPAEEDRASTSPVENQHPASDSPVVADRADVAETTEALTAPPETPVAVEIPTTTESPGPTEAPAAPETSVVTETLGEPAPVASSAAQAQSELVYWLRPLILGVLVVILLGLTYWDQRRMPDRPLPPDVLLATPPASGTVSVADPALAAELGQLRNVLQRRDARRLASQFDPDGVIVAPYGGNLPDGGYTVTNGPQFSQEILSGAQMSLLGWRNDGRGHVVVLADGFQEKPLRLSANGTLDLTSLVAIGLTSHGGTWYVRWFLPDPNSVLAQQARSLPWQPWPNT
jgi:hypothetical protein